MKGRSVIPFSVLLASCLLVGRAHAVETPVCLEASQRGQEARDSGKLVEARQHFTTCGDPSCPQPVPTYCADWLKDVNRRVPSLVFRVTDARGRDMVDVTTTIDSVVAAARLDGRAVEVNPGSHKVVFQQGAARAELDLLVAENEKGRVVTATLEVGAAPPGLLPKSSAPAPSETPPATPYRPVPTSSWIAWGVGAAALVGFGAFGLKARSDFDDFKSTCGSRCTSDDRDSVKSTVLVADVLLVAGIVSASVGTVLYLTRPTSTRQVGFAPLPRVSGGLAW